MKTVALAPGDEPRVEQLLVRHSDTSLILRSNLRSVGLAWEGKRLQGNWTGVEEDGELVAVACHAWNGNLVLQAPVHVAELSRAAVAATKRAVRGLIGPWPQVQAARGALGLKETRGVLETPERLYALTISELRVPGGEWLVRRVTPEDLEAIIAHRAKYVVEAIGETPGPQTLPEAREAVGRSVDYFALIRDGRLVCSGCFNARVPGCVQLGGIYTPPEERSRGHAKRLVAGMLRHAAAEGVTRAVLFTPQDNFSAQRAYESVGFTAIGEYRLILFAA
jgi:ribosomal protein S18 acetylase RimI-like enzyme